MLNIKKINGKDIQFLDEWKTLNIEYRKKYAMKVDNNTLSEEEGVLYTNWLEKHNSLLCSFIKCRNIKDSEIHDSKTIAIHFLNRLWKEERKMLSKKKKNRIPLCTGKYNRIIYDISDSHIMLFGGPKRGKTSGLIIPSLLTWGGSVFCFVNNDDCVTYTFKKRASISKIFKLDLLSEMSHSFNPLAEIRKGNDEHDDVMAISEIIVSSNPSTGKADALLLSGSIYHVLHSVKINIKSLSSVHDYILNGLSEMSRDDALKTIHTSFADGIKDISEREYKNIISRLLSDLALFSDPVIAENTNRSDFKLKDLFIHDSPISVYFKIDYFDYAWFSLR